MNYVNYFVNNTNYLNIFKTYKYTFRSSSKPLWGISVTLVPGSSAVMQNNGNFVIYSPSGNALWAPGINLIPGSSAVMQNDGNFVSYSPTGSDLWSTGTTCE